MQLFLGRLPIHLSGSGAQLYRKPLQGFIEFSDGFLFVDSFKALQSFNFRVRRFSDRVGQFRLPAARRAFQQNGLIELARQVNNRGRHLVGDVSA
jgi:hypothetical protein